MKVIYGINAVKRYKNAVVALGVFDGVHRAHRRILKFAARTARRIGGVSIVITFYPHPQKKQSLYSLEHRLRLISELGIDACMVIKFNQRFAKTPACDFIKNILVKKIGARYICVGRNFRFGQNAQGDIAFLRKYSRIYNFKLKVFDLIRINRYPVSSTYIRKLITEGFLSTAEKLLGRRLSLFGTVIKGSSLAKNLGFPTANIDPHHEVLPPSGVYAVYVFLGKKKFGALCYIGKPARQWFGFPHSQSQKQVEAHILNFRKNIYGADLEVQFIKKIRDKKRFSSRASLIKQIKKDAHSTRQILQGRLTHHNI